MRHIGNLPNEEQASTFEDFMLASEMRVKVDPEDGEWAVWVIEEDQFEAAREQLAKFREDPSDHRYNSHSGKAREIRRKEKKAAEQYKKNQIDVRTRWGNTRAGLRAGPVTKALIGISIVAGLMTGLTSGPDGLFPWLTFIDVFNTLGTGPTIGFEGILAGQVWRLITPIFIHFGPLHILFNMMWMYQLGPQIESRLGPVRFLILVLVIAAISNTGQFVWDRMSPPGFSLFGGMSGVVCGLFGYIWMKTRFEPQERYVLHQQTITFMLVFLALCTFGVFGNIANGAHLVGLLCGVVFGYWKTFVRQNLS